MENCHRVWAGKYRAAWAGRCGWAKVFAALTAARYDDVVSIKHEDCVFERDEKVVKRGFYISRDILKPYIHWQVKIRFIFH